MTIPMKTITKELMNFALTFGLGALVFRYLLSHLLDSESSVSIWVLSVGYFVFNFLIGWYFGKREYMLLPLYDIGFRVHFTTYLIFNLVSFAWFCAGFHSRFERPEHFYYTALYWGIALAIHFLFFISAKRKTIRGLHKKDLFQ